MHSAERSVQARPESFKLKKLAVFVLIGIIAVLLLVNLGFILRDIINIYIPASVIAWLFIWRIIGLILLAGEAYLVYLENSIVYVYIGCAIVMGLNIGFPICCLIDAIKHSHWSIWLLLPFTVLLVIAMVLYWLALKQMRNGSQSASAATGPPIIASKTTTTTTDGSTGTNATPSATSDKSITPTVPAK